MRTDLCLGGLREFFLKLGFLEHGKQCEMLLRFCVFKCCFTVAMKGYVCSCCNISVFAGQICEVCKSVFQPAITVHGLAQVN